MAQFDYSVANQSGQSFRADLNNGLAAIVSNNSGASEPSTMYAYQWWADTTTGLLKQRNAANSAWITIGTLASANLGLLASGGTLTAAAGSAGTPSITFTGATTDTGIYSPGTDQVAIATAGNQRLLIDASGNINIDSDTLYVDAVNNRVGIGTSSASSILHVKDTTQSVNTWTSISNCASNASFRFQGSNHANGYGLFMGYANAVNDAQGIQATTNAGNTGLPLALNPFGGNVGIGTTGPSNLLHLRSDSTSNIDHLYLHNRNGGANSGARIAFSNGTNDYADNRYAYIGAINTGASESGNHLVFATNANGGSATEKARLDSSGRLLLNTTNTSPIHAARSIVLTTVQNGDIAVNHSTSNDPGDPFARFGYNGNQIGSITQSGTTAVAYNTSSDYRLKESVVPLVGAADRINQLQVHRFNFIADPSTTVDGFLAHEAQAVVPECVTGTKDEVDDDGNPVYQGIDQSKLVPLLTAALQEALAKIEVLEQRLTNAGIA